MDTSMSLLRERYASSRILRISRSLEITSAREVEFGSTILGADDGNVPGLIRTAFSSVSVSITKIVSEATAARRPTTVRRCRDVIGCALKRPDITDTRARMVRVR